MKATVQKEEEQPEVGEMKRGDYMIHILLEKAKDMDGESDTIDPLIEISCLGEKKYSQVKKDIGRLGEVTYNEHIFMEPRNVEKKDAEEAQIVIRLMDKGFFKDTQIGMFEFNLSFIYFREDHMLLHQWIAFSNPNSENYQAITGYLKLSISVVAPGDEQVQMPEDDNENDEDDVMMPP